MDHSPRSVAILAQAILALEPFLVRTCAVFSRSRVSVLSKCLHTSFVVSPLGFTASIDDGSDAPISPMPGTSSNNGSPNVLAMISTEWVTAQSMHSSKELRDILLPLARGFADFDNHVKTLCEAVGMVTSRIASVEQTVSPLC